MAAVSLLRNAKNEYNGTSCWHSLGERIGIWQAAYRARLRCRLWLHARLGAHVFERQRGHAPLVAAAVKRHVPRFRPAYHPDHGCRSGKRNEMGRGVGALAPGHCPFRPCPNRRDMSSHEQQGIRLRCRRSRLRPWVWRVPLAVGRRQQPHPRRKAHAFPMPRLHVRRTDLLSPSPSSCADCKRVLRRLRSLVGCHVVLGGVSRKTDDEKRRIRKRRRQCV